MVYPQSGGLRQSGFMTVELLGVLLFSVMLIAGAAIVFQQAMASHKTQDAKVLLRETTRNVERAFATRANYENLTLASAIDLGLVPTPYRSGIGPGGANLALAPWTADSRHFEIRLTFSSAASAYPWCIELLDNSDGHWVRTGVNPAALQPDHTLATLTTVCRGNAVLHLVR